MARQILAAMNYASVAVTSVGTENARIAAQIIASSDPAYPDGFGTTTAT
jgi:hypothetical protein